MGEENVAAERKPSDAVFDAVFGAVGPNGGAETDGEALNEHPASPGGEEMSELVDKDRAAEKDDDEKDRPDIGEDGGEEFHFRILDS